MKAIDFFSGCGGASEGLRQAGLDIILGLDFDENAAASYRQNFPEAEYIEGDIRTVSVKHVMDLVEKKNPNREPVLFSACAPCQPFSSQNKFKSEDDSRRTLLDRTHPFISKLMPEYIMIENVPGIQKVNEKIEGPYKRFIEFLGRKGYKCTTFIAKAENYGVPQRRKRFVLIASRLGVVPIPSETHGINMKPHVTVRKAISRCPPLEAGASHPKDRWHISAAITAINLERIKQTPEGGDRRNWPSYLVNDCHKNYSGHTDTYGRMKWDAPAPTLTTKCHSYTNGRFGHPDVTQNRAISIREAALIQTFPKNYIFCGNTGSMARQIGNAVPCELARQFGLSILKHFKNQKEQLYG